MVAFLESPRRDPGDVLATGVCFLGASRDGFWSDRGGFQMTFWPRATGFEVPRGPILSGFWSSRGGFQVTFRIRVGDIMVPCWGWRRWCILTVRWSLMGGSQQRVRAKAVDYNQRTLGKPQILFLRTLLIAVAWHSKRS